MFCNQCEQTPAGGCTVVGVCGKDETISSLQDTIIYGLKGIAAYRTHANQLGYTDSFVDTTTQEALYMTLTNSNFNRSRTYRNGDESGSGYCSRDGDA